MTKGVTEGLGPHSAAPRATPNTVPGGYDKEVGIQAYAHQTPTLLNPIIRILERKTEAKEEEMLSFASCLSTWLLPIASVFMRTCLLSEG